MRLVLSALGLGALMLLTSGTAEAQGVRFGLHGNWGTGLRDPYLTEDGGDAELGAGVRVLWELGLDHEGLGMLGSIDVSKKRSTAGFFDPATFEEFEIGGRYWEFNAGLTYTRGGRRLKLYCGLGFNVANDTLDEDFITTFEDGDALDIGGNVLFGARLME